MHKIQNWSPSLCSLRRFRSVAMLTMTVLVAGVSCAPLEEDDEEFETSEAELRSDAKLQGDAITEYNNEPDSVLVWNQNIGQMGMPKDAGENWKPKTKKVFEGKNWRNIIQCARDSACNTFGKIPDVFMLQECSTAMAEAFVNRLENKLPKGKNNTWSYYAVDNYFDFEKHWLSSCIIYRHSRFDVKMKDSIRMHRSQGGTDECLPTSKDREAFFPYMLLRDKLRNSDIKLVTKHDDHFSSDNRFTCDETEYNSSGITKPDNDHLFCTLKNNIQINGKMNELKVDLGIISGDWNYQAKKCGGLSFLRCAYVSTTATADQSVCGIDKSLGWRDPMYENNRDAYDDDKIDIDYIHTLWSSGDSLMPTKDKYRNIIPGRIGKCFYCNLESSEFDAYSTIKDIKGSQLSSKLKGKILRHVMSDHDGLLMKIKY